MKKPSAPRADGQRREVVYFVDRCLGKKFPRLLSEAGLRVVPYDRMYPDDDAVSDPDWLVESSSAGYVSLSHDKSMRFTDSTMERFFEGRFEPSSALFVLRGDQRAEDHAAMFLAAQREVERMIRRYRKLRLAFVAHILRAREKRGREVVRVEKRLDHNGWIARFGKKGPR